MMSAYGFFTAKNAPVDDVTSPTSSTSAASMRSTKATSKTLKTSREVSEKRAEQNRRAQQAFRRKKSMYMKTLEEELEQNRLDIAALRAENENLRKFVESFISGLSSNYPNGLADSSVPVGHMMPGGGVSALKASPLTQPFFPIAEQQPFFAPDVSGTDSFLGTYPPPRQQQPIIDNVIILEDDPFSLGFDDELFPGLGFPPALPAPLTQTSLITAVACHQQQQQQPAFNFLVESSEVTLSGDGGSCPLLAGACKNVDNDDEFRVAKQVIEGLSSVKKAKDAMVDALTGLVENLELKVDRETGRICPNMPLSKKKLIWDKILKVASREAFEGRIWAKKQ